MDVSATFMGFTENIKIKNTDDISKKYKNITKILNKKYYNSTSEISHSLQVGSYGRKTGIHGISDLDMVFELPNEVYEKYNSYKSNGQSALLQDLKNTLLETYSTSEIKGDGQVIVIDFRTVKIEILPVFLLKDGSYIHPNSNNGGSWELTKPRQEIIAMRDKNNETNKNFRRLCQIVRAWKNKSGTNMSGYLIDTLCYKFFSQNSFYDNKSFGCYDHLVKDFFKYLSEIDKDKNYWIVPGSEQRVYRKDKFVPRAKKTYEKILKAIEKASNKTVNNMWRNIFGNSFPSSIPLLESNMSYRDTEEFIDKLYPVDIKASLRIDCEVTQDGWRKQFLSSLGILRINKKLDFFISETSQPDYDKILWKVRNIGEEAERRDCIRGNIIEGTIRKTEHTSFKGEHFVECYLIKDNVCIARDQITVPIAV